MFLVSTIVIHAQYTFELMNFTSLTKWRNLFNKILQVKYCMNRKNLHSIFLTCPHTERTTDGELRQVLLYMWYGTPSGHSALRKYTFLFCAFLTWCVKSCNDVSSEELWFSDLMLGADSSFFTLFYCKRGRTFWNE